MSNTVQFTPKPFAICLNPENSTKFRPNHSKPSNTVNTQPNPAASVRICPISFNLARIHPNALKSRSDPPISSQMCTNQHKTEEYRTNQSKPVEIYANSSALKSVQIHKESQWTKQIRSPPSQTRHGYAQTYTKVAKSFHMHRNQSTSVQIRAKRPSASKHIQIRTNRVRPSDISPQESNVFQTIQYQYNSSEFC